MGYPRVCIIVLNWNGLEDTRECLKSLQDVEYPNYEVVLVDNGSDGDDCPVLMGEFGGYIRLVQNDRNYGCGEGFNAGIRHAMQPPQPDYILITNNDIVVAPDFLDELVKVVESDKQIGLVGPKVYYYDYQGRKDVIWSAGGRIRWWLVEVHRLIEENLNDSPDYSPQTEVDWVSGAVLMFRSCLVEEVGLLDPWYFFGHEDIDYCLRARQRNFRTVYVPTARVWHKVGASARKAHVTYASPARYYHFVKRNFSLPVYIYQLLMLPRLLWRWAVLYVTKVRDRRMLARFALDLGRFILRGSERRA